jgi:hypothetical protein
MSTFFPAKKITSVKVIFPTFFYNLYLLKIFDTPLHSIAWKKLHSPASFSIMFLKWIKKKKGLELRALCFSPDELDSLPRAVKDQFI